MYFIPLVLIKRSAFLLAACGRYDQSSELCVALNWVDGAGFGTHEHVWDGKGTRAYAAYTH